MDKIFSTRDVPAADRFAYWHDIFCREIMPHDCRPTAGRNFHGEIDGGNLADLGVTRLVCSPQQNTHGLDHVARTNSDDFLLARASYGKLWFEQNGQEATITGCDMVLCDPMLPFRTHYSEDTQLILLSIPRRALASRIGSPETLVGRLIEPRAGDAGLASNFMAALPAHVGSLSPQGEAIIREHALDLIAVTAGNLLDRRPDLSSAARLTIMKLRTFTESKLHDLSLDRDAIAAGAGVSVRHANKLLALDGTSISQLLLERRLARCRRLLSDPTQSHRHVSEIAIACGFADVTHFARLFKKAYGFAPRDYRQLASGPTEAMFWAQNGDSVPAEPTEAMFSAQNGD